jgi:hypothetical protein
LAHAAEAPRVLSAEVDLELRNHVAEYWARVDRRGSVRDCESFFTPDATMVLGTLRICGRTALATFFQERDARETAQGRTTRHVVANMRTRALEADRAVVDATVLVFAGVGEWPLPAEAPTGLGDFSFVCVRDADAGWLFEAITAESVFAGASAPAFARRQADHERR